jgi:hypothetical protein
MNALKLCLSGTALSMLVGCATWDWEAASAYAASPQYQAYVSNLIQQQNLNQQLATQQYLAENQAMIQRNLYNWQAQQNLINLNRRLDSIQYEIGNLNRPGYQWRSTVR